MRCSCGCGRLLRRHSGGVGLPSLGASGLDVVLSFLRFGNGAAVSADPVEGGGAMSSGPVHVSVRLSSDLHERVRRYAFERRLLSNGAAVSLILDRYFSALDFGKALREEQKNGAASVGAETTRGCGKD